MSENDYETVLTFRKSKYFWKFVNRQMLIYDTDNLNDSDYKLLLFSSLPDNINNAINEDTGCLKSATGLTQITTGFTNVSFNLGIAWLDDGENGFTLFLDSAENIELEIDEGVSFNVKGVMLVKETGSLSSSNTNFVVAYARLSTPITCQNSITLQAYSEFVGHNSCSEV